jgi:hypothetical protein
MEATKRLRFLEQTSPETLKGGEASRQNRIASMREYIDKLKIQADINDPLVKRRFEDGLGKSHFPISYIRNHCNRLTSGGNNQATCPNPSTGTTPTAAGAQWTARSPCSA